MAEYAVMPKADYQDACDAVREMTGGTDTIKSGDLGAQIRAIEGGGSGSLSSFYLSYPTGETVRVCYDPSVCYDWNSFIASEYNTGRFYAGDNLEGNYCVMTRFDTSEYEWYISGTENNLDMPLEDGATYTVTYWVP